MKFQFNCMSAVCMIINCILAS